MDRLKEARECLSPQSVQDFDDIVEQRILGASTHIKMIGKMLIDIARDAVEYDKDLEHTYYKINTVAQYFMDTRGEASQAISNAIYLFIHDTEDKNLIELQKQLMYNYQTYVESQTKAIDKIVEFAGNLVEEMETLFLYDYSSTVDKFIEHIPPKNIFIAESSVINGGYPFIETAIEAKHHIKIIPDAAIIYYLKRSDAVFMGAETYYPDGTAFNTIGSDIVELGCQRYDKPLYILTPLIKVDTRPIIGKEKKLVFNDYRDKYENVNYKKIDLSQLDFMVPELIPVDNKVIEAFITEKGIIPSDQMYTISLTYYKEIGGENLV